MNVINAFISTDKRHTSKLSFHGKKRKVIRKRVLRREKTEKLKLVEYKL
jgi:hypothetical protein